MELYQLRTFQAVARTGNLTRAAEQLAASQPAVSAQIKALEEEFALPLFLRTAKGMALTPAGSELLAQAEAVLTAGDRLQQLARTLQTELVGTLRVGLNEDGNFLRITELCNLAAARHNRLKLCLLASSSTAILQELERNSLDCGFIFGDFPKPGITGVHLHTQRIMVTAPAAWKDRITGASWHDLLHMPWAWQSPSCPYRVRAERFFQAMELETPESVFSADQDATILAIVASGASLGLVKEPDAIQAADAGKVVIWDGDCLEIDLAFVYRRDRRHEPLIQAASQLISEVWHPATAGAAA